MDRLPNEVLRNMTSPVRATDFVESIGVNTHMSYDDSKYVNLRNVVADLDYLGLSSVRDAAPNYASKSVSATYQLLAFDRFASLGIRIDMVANRDPAAVVTDIAKFAAAHPGAVEAVEGPNEINVAPITYHGLTGTAGATAYMKDLVAAIGKNAALKDVDIYGLTGAAASAQKSVNAGTDFTNVHIYPAFGDQPGSYIATVAQNPALGSTPLVITEIGYYTAPINTYGKVPTYVAWGGVDQLTQAKLTLNLLMDASKYGVAHTYLYQLLDAYADPSGTSVDKNLGLFDINNNPKLAATAIHNLTSILADSGATADSFQTWELAYDVKNLSSLGSSIALQKSNGVTDIIVWEEPDIWDQVNYKQINVAESSKTIDFGDNHVSVVIYDPLTSDKAVASYTDVTSVSVSVKDHPIIIEVTDIPDPVSTTAITAAKIAVMAELSSAEIARLDATVMPAKAGASGTTVTTTMTASHSAFVGNAANDKVTGTAVDNVIIGSDGNDVIYGRAGQDSLYGGAGADKLYGEDGRDLLSGGAGNDLLTAGAGGDTLIGGAGDDVFYGGAGDEHYLGGAGRDVYYGSDGKDMFHFASGDSLAATRTGMDVIFKWSSVDSLDVGLKGTQANYYEGTAASYAAAQALAIKQLATANLDIISIQVGKDVVVYVENDPTHAGVDLSFVLDATSLSSIDYSVFV